MEQTFLQLCRGASVPEKTRGLALIASDQDTPFTFQEQM